MSPRIKTLFATSAAIFALLLATPAFAQSQATAPANGGITAIPLAAPAPMAEGIASPSELGLSEELWSDVSFAVWQGLLKGLADGMANMDGQTSPTLRNLVTAAVGARSALPGEGPAPATAADITLLRARALAPYAGTTRFNLFLAAQPLAAKSDALIMLQRDMTFTSDPARGCQLEQALVGGVGPQADDAGAPWHIYCLLASNAPDQAQVQIDAMHENAAAAQADGAADALRAIDAYVTGDEKAGPDRLNLFAVRTMGLSPNLSLSQPAVGSLARRAKLDVLAARHGGEAPESAEALASAGYADAHTLIAIYDAFAPPARTEEAAAILPPAQRRALLWQLMSNGQDAGDANVRARRLNDFVASGGAASLLGARGAPLMQIAGMIPPAPALAWASPALFALAAAQDSLPLANIWYQTAADLLPSLPQAESWLVRMWPVALIDGVDGADASFLSAWVASAAALPPASRPPVAGVLTLLEARGVVVSPELWKQAGAQDDTSLGGGSGTADPSQLELLKKAAASSGGRQGEIILRGAILVGADPAQAPVPTMAALIRALTQARLNHAADRLTVEALLALLYPPAS